MTSWLGFLSNYKLLLNLFYFFDFIRKRKKNFRRLEVFRHNLRSLINEILGFEVFINIFI